MLDDSRELAVMQLRMVGGIVPRHEDVELWSRCTLQRLDPSEMVRWSDGRMQRRLPF